MPVQHLRARILPNSRVDRSGSYPAHLRQILSLAGAEEARAAITRWEGYAPTPLRRLDAMAAECGVAEVLYKDEGQRFGLKAFKALGGAYAVERLVAARGGPEGLTVTCATDGNHGRAVAWGARRLGVRAVIYIHEGVSEGRAAAIASYGAEVRREGAHYDQSVRASADAAKANGWEIVSDTAWPGYEETPKSVMQGYAMLAMEADAAGARPTHVFVQGGVGGVAAGVLSWRWERFGPERPVLVVVEPEKADCLYRSAAAGRWSTSGGDLDTIMAGLACGEPSTLAWRVLDVGADAFMTIPDEAAAETMRDLAALGVVGGESGVAGLAGFRLAAQDRTIRETLKLDQSSRVLLYGTEGATDAEVYARIVGRKPEEVAP